MQTAQQTQSKVHDFTPEQVDLIKQRVAQDATDDELALFLYQASRTGLDPLAKQIYFQKRINRKTNRSEITIITGIDGYRLIADRTGKYAGNDDPVFDAESSPAKATVTVYKIVGGIVCAFTASARWDQYYPGDAQGFMWRKMPHLMLGKCAEALALRKAFPAELSGIYIREEMEQADREPIEAKNERAAQVKPATRHAEPAKPQPAKVAQPAPTADVIFDDSNPEHMQRLENALKKGKIDEQIWDAVAVAMRGKPTSKLWAVVVEIKKDFESYRAQSDIPADYVDPSDKREQDEFRQQHFPQEDPGAKMPHESGQSAF